MSHLVETPTNPYRKGLGAHPASGGKSDLGRIVFADEFPLPLAVLKQSALDHNRRWMRRFLQKTGIDLCPHGKTSMSPQLFQMQLDDGAWGITAATAHHVRLYASFGVKRILLANQLIGKGNILWVLDALADDPEREIPVFVDSIAGIDHLAAVVAASGFGGKVSVLIEMGIAGKRTGCRDWRDGLALARRISRHGDGLALAGIGLYEGVVKAGCAASEAAVRRLYRETSRLLEAVDQEGLWTCPTVLVSAGGSVFLDWAAGFLRDARVGKAMRLVLRSGCYLTSDAQHYARANDAMMLRSPQWRALGAWKPALEVWAHLQSRPEPGLMVAALGKRDISYDIEPPLLQQVYRMDRRECRPFEGSAEVVALYDQHAVIKVGEPFDGEVGDLLGFSMAHPCTTFDKWRCIPVVDDAYRVVDQIETYF